MLKNNFPFLVLLDTNFIYFSFKNKINLFEELFNCLCNFCIPIVPYCVLNELEGLGPKFRFALKCIKNQKIIKLECFHSSKNSHADDCIYSIIKKFKCFAIATCDKHLKKKIKKVTNMPIISIRKKKFYIENR